VSDHQANLKDPCGLKPVAVDWSRNEVVGADGTRYPFSRVVKGKDRFDNTEQTWTVVTVPGRAEPHNAAPLCITGLPGIS
jgi:hypothetical protein